MPHLRGKPHKRKKVGSSDGGEVFLNEITGAVTTSYSEHRSCQLEALEPIWVCSVTGLRGLTFEEATQCEKHAMELLSNIQPELGIPLLYLASRTQCVEFTEMVDLVSTYIENRYFVGEVVDIKREDGWCLGTVAEVHTSLDNEVEASQRSGEHLPAKVFYYSIEFPMEDGEPKMLAEANNLRRRHDQKSITEYLRLFFEKSQNGIWEIRDHVRLLYGLEQYQFQNVFWGNPPRFPRHKVISEMAEKESPNREAAKKVLQVTLERYFSPHSSKRPLDTENENLQPVKKLRAQTDVQKPTMKISTKYKVVGKDLHGQRKVGQTSKQKYRPQDRPKCSLEPLLFRRLEVEEKRKVMEEKRKEKAAVALEEKRRMVEQKRLEKAKLKEEKQRLAQSALEARQFREDLECEDLKVLPTFSKVQCCIPDENFADFMVLLEFLHSFKETLPVKTYFPHGISFEIAERAFTVEEAEGTFSDILLLLMSSLFTLQGDEDEKVDEPETRHFGQLEDFDDHVERALELAAATRNYTHLCHGIPLRQFRLDSFSISEVVRLHFLTSGGYLEEKRTKWRYMRGGYSERDDPGLAFCIAEPELLNDMAYRSIQELALEDKLKIVLCLIHQLMTYPSVRDVIDKRGEKLRQMKMDIRQQQNEVKKKRDFLNLRLKEKKGTKPKGEEDMQSDAQNVVTHEDSEVEQIRIEKEILRKQQEATKKAKELAKIAMGFRAVPLGTDRLFRRYWTFSSLPGLFMEHRGDSIEFLSSSASYKLSSAPVSDIGENPASSDKENDDSASCKSRLSNSPSKKMLAENNSTPSLTSEKLGVVVQSTNKSERDPKGVHLHQDVVSTTSREFPASREPVWSFCCKEEDFHLLVERLNAIGIREGPLRQVLQKEKERILESVQSCPAYKLNPAYVDASNVPEVRKSSRNNPASNKDGRNFGHPLGTPLPQIWCEMLRDEILDLDDRLYQGGLSVLDVQNRDAWREALANKTYDMQCERLVWGFQAKSDDQETPLCSIRNAGSEDIDSPDQEIHRAIKSPFHFAHLSPSDPGIITAYACAILQVEQCIPKKNLKHTFVADKPAEEISQLERWEMSLMNSTSYSQLYVHLLTLHNNVYWSKSVLKAYCRTCRRRGDAEKLLLCDECNKGYHTYCLKPKLNRIPHGDWFCSVCAQKVTARQDTSQHRSTSEEPEAKGSPCKSSVEKCDVCGLGGPTFLCSTCHGHFHVECCDPSTMKRTSCNWQCRTCSLREGKKLKKAGSPVHEDKAALSSNLGGGVGTVHASSNCRRLCFEEPYLQEKASPSHVPAEQSPNPLLLVWRDKPMLSSSSSNSSFSSSLESENSLNSSLEVQLASSCSSLSSSLQDNVDSRFHSRSSLEEEEASRPCSRTSSFETSRCSNRLSNRYIIGRQYDRDLLHSLLLELIEQNESRPFLKLISRPPAPGYYSRVRRPMDLTAVRAKLASRQYKSNNEFLRDIMLMFNNINMYNTADVELSRMARKLQTYFYKRCKQLNLMK
ncbi:bromodomain adjacent to zinc finger domain protein 1A [Anabrus simplex]|uniref:bromodomain adjacent to zinc finger domain protein 1A n=1 Tax=Anabrus simplex TaxID=316456 RepID=UPI0035A28D20